ncbi:MAG TPA: hypothetical protein VKR58_02045 [Aquella sp.]|nr:hypothetical protein [Aquella sp.]
MAPYSNDKRAWIKSGDSPNPLGRKIARNTIRRSIERFLKKNISARALQTLYDHLEPKDKLSLLLQLLPYNMAKATIQSEWERLDDKQIDELYAKAIEGVNKQIKISENETKA